MLSKFDKKYSGQKKLGFRSHHHLSPNSGTLVCVIHENLCMFVLTLLPI